MADLPTRRRWRDGPLEDGAAGKIMRKMTDLKQVRSVCIKAGQMQCWWLTILPMSRDSGKRVICGPPLQNHGSAWHANSLFHPAYPINFGGFMKRQLAEGFHLIEPLRSVAIIGILPRVACRVIPRPASPGAKVSEIVLAGREGATRDAKLSVRWRSGLVPVQQFYANPRRTVL